jgi:integrase
VGRVQDPFRSRLLRRRAPTLRDWCAYWLDTDSAKRPKSKKEDASTLELHVYADLVGTRIDAITRHDVQMLVARWAADVMPRTVHRRYAVLRAVMNVDAELLDRSPCRPIRMPASAPAAAYALTPAEVARLARETGSRYAPMIFTAGMLGLRFCECAALRVGRIDLERGTISIEEGLVEAESGRLYSNPPKSSAGRRTMCMPTSLLTMLNGHLDGVGVDRDDERALVFTSPTGGPLRYSNFRKRVWYPAVERAGLPPIGFHDLRRAAATVLVANNVDMKTAQVRLGHADAALTLKVYAQATTAQDRVAAALIDSHFADVVDLATPGALVPEAPGLDIMGPC